MQEIRSRKKTASVGSDSLAKTAAAEEEEANGRGTGDEEVHRGGAELVDGEREVMESRWQIALEVFFPYIVAGLGMVGAGAVLNIVKQWKVFVDVSEIVILVPALLGLKGNLEMTLASRLSTQVNLGNLDVSSERLSIAGGNLALTQVQAVVVGFLSSLFAILLSWIPRRKSDIRHGILLITSSILTASLASLILGSLVIGVVMISRRCRVNPDNVATPIAGSLGDLTTILILAAISSALSKNLENSDQLLLPLLLLLLVLAVVPIWCYVAHKSKYTCDVLYSGWTPVIGAMVIRIGGNLVAIQASRLSTALHKASTPGTIPTDFVHGCPRPCSSVYGSAGGARSAQVLLALVVPGQLIFTAAVCWLHRDEWTASLGFIAAYLLAALTQVALLLHLANWLVHWLWGRGSDPDNSAIPYLTSVGDLLGAVLLAVAFYVSA